MMARLVLALLAMSCNCARVRVSMPVSSLAAMAPSTAARLPLLTPVTPILPRSSAVSAGVGVPPAAAVWMALAMRARVSISSTVSTPLAACLSMMLLSRLRA